MATFRIVCAEHIESGNHPRHGRIVAVGIGNDADRASERRTVDQVLTQMDTGDNFVVRGPTTGRTARVEKYWCTPCGRWHIRTVADATNDNNLDSLRACRWR